MSTVSSNPTEARVVHVNGPRPTPGQLVSEVRDVAVVAPLFATAPLLRHWHRRWGATDAEVAAAMPGDELVPGAQTFCTRAITIDAPPEAVWPWLVQVGFGKAGFYSNDLLDNVAHPSADRILDEFQNPKVDALMSLVLNEFGDFPMMRKMLRTLKQRAEAELPAKGPGSAT